MRKTQAWLSFGFLVAIVIAFLVSGVQPFRLDFTNPEASRAFMLTFVLVWGLAFIFPTVAYKLWTWLQ